MRSLKAIAFLAGSLWLAIVPTAGATPVLHQIAAANIGVVQNDTNNNTTSVTVTTRLSINDFRIRAGSNRADYNVQIGNASTDDVTNGILISSIDQNGRDNGEGAPYSGMNYGTSAIDSNATGSPGSSGEYWIPVFQAPNNGEYNLNVAAAYFPYASGWYGGWLNNSSGNNGAANNHLIGHPSLVLGTHVIDNGGGKTTVDLRSFGLDSRTNAILLVVGGKNEANFALSAPNTNGTWTISCHDDNGGSEQDYVGFVCVPLTNHTVVSGRFRSDLSIALQSETFHVTNPGVGTYHLSIPGVNPTDGVLIISAEAGGTNNLDNIVSYQANGDGWDIQTRDLTTGFTPALQNLPDSDAVVSFIYIPGPGTSFASLVWTGSPTNVWSLSGSNVWRIAGSNTPAAYADGSQVIFDDSASNFVVNLTAPVSPQGVVVSNAVNNYIVSGSGKITGAAGLTKYGGGKITLATTNDYAGDTFIAQGSLVLGASFPIPGGNGGGDFKLSGTLDVAGFGATLNNLSGNGTIDNLTVGGAVKLEVYETTNSTFSGALKNTTGSLALLVDGGGTLMLSGANSFSGGTTVSNAMLVVNTSLGTGGAVVQAGAILSGTGTVSGSVSLADGSALQLTANVPLTVGSLALNGVVNIIPTGVSITHSATYALLQHGTKSGTGSFKLVLPPGLQANGFTATLQDTGSQLQMVVAPSGITGTIGDVRHVVILMNENRSFDHYFGTLHDTRGFDDRNALRFTNGTSAFQQPTGASYELPFHTTIQCIGDLNHTWPVTHTAINGGKNDQWIPSKTPPTMAYFERADIPYYYGLADAYTICDEYHCSVLSSTYPNRVSLMTGMIDPHSTGGGPEIDNSTLDTGFTWKTYPELLQQAGITWKVYQVSGNNSDNVLKIFAAYKQAPAGNPLHDRGMVASSSLSAMVSAFQNDVTQNTLPSVSWIIGPDDFTEHPPWSPANGEVLTKQLLDAVASNPAVYKSTVFIFNYDENDGFFDHAIPILPPAGTPDEFVGNLPIGLGIRVPAILISPWTRGGRICSQVFDHTSTIRFLENWTGVKEPNISAWRRQVCGDLTSAFDFAHPDTNYPSLTSVTGITCEDGTTPTVPAIQTMPTHESGGTLVRLPLPYQPNAFCTLNSGANSFAITMTNSGAASVHFGIYPNAFRNDGPWPFDVDIADSASTAFNVAAAAGKYDFSCYGPNGFQRRFAGNLSADYQHIEAVSVLNPWIAGIQIALANQSASPVTFTVTNGYTVNGVVTYIVPAGSTNFVNIGSETNGGYYDVTVTASADSSFVRRFLGRVEQYSVAAPLISSSTIMAGTNFQFTFGGPAGQPYSIMTNTNLAATNWNILLSGYFGANAVAFTETNTSLQPARFYRVISP